MPTITISPGVAAALAGDDTPPTASPLSAWLVGMSNEGTGGTRVLGSVRTNAGAGSLSEDAGARRRREGNAFFFNKYMSVWTDRWHIPGRRGGMREAREGGLNREGGEWAHRQKKIALPFSSYLAPLPFFLAQPPRRPSCPQDYSSWAWAVLRAPVPRMQRPQRWPPRPPPSPPWLTMMMSLARSGARPWWWPPSRRWPLELPPWPCTTPREGLWRSGKTPARSALGWRVTRSPCASRARCLWPGTVAAARLPSPSSRARPRPYLWRAPTGLSCLWPAPPRSPWALALLLWAPPPACAS